MENASKALLMAAGVLIGMLILSLAVFLFIDFGAKSKEIHTEIEATQLTQYNAQYTIYDGRKDITIYEIVTLANLAKENNEYYRDYTDFDDYYKVSIKLSTKLLTNQNFQDSEIEEQQKLIEYYNEVNENGEAKFKFRCDGISYHNTTTGRVKMVQIREVE